MENVGDGDECDIVPNSNCQWMTRCEREDCIVGSFVHVSQP